MKGKKGLSISDFAEFSRTKRTDLIYLDKIGLLQPHSRGKNRYRSYSAGQLAIANLINILRKLGTPMDEIGELIKRRTPEIVDDLFGRQIIHIDNMIRYWVGARKLLTVLQDTMRSVRGVDTNAITVERLPAQPVTYGGINDYGQDKDDYDALLDFYRYFSKNRPDMDLNYPVWGAYSESRVRRGDISFPDRYYFYNPEGLDSRPAALYAVGYCCGDYGKAKELYKRMIKYIDANGYVVCGPAFEEYPLNEVCIANTEYMIRFLITVRKKA